jgi:hypothetical protein
MFGAIENIFGAKLANIRDDWILLPASFDTELVDAYG